MLFSDPPPLSKTPSSATARKALRWEISGILIFKLAVILLAGFTIFGARHRVHVGMETMSNQLFGSAISSAAPK
jgi:hypothetical protein